LPVQPPPAPTELPERAPDAVATGPSPTEEPASPPLGPPRRAPVPGTPSALPGRARAEGELRVEVAAEPAVAGVTTYTVRLRERSGAPVAAAEVTIRGRRPDGQLVEATLDPTPEPGVYRASLRMADLANARLRVASTGRIQDLPLQGASR
jgi:hypothetical protein